MLALRLRDYGSPSLGIINPLPTCQFLYLKVLDRADNILSRNHRISICTKRITKAFQIKYLEKQTTFFSKFQRPNIESHKYPFSQGSAFIIAPRISPTAIASSGDLQGRSNPRAVVASSPFLVCGWQILFGLWHDRIVETFVVISRIGAWADEVWWKLRMLGETDICDYLECYIYDWVFH
jgi:hypothetical protein